MEEWHSIRTNIMNEYSPGEILKRISTNDNFNQGFGILFSTTLLVKLNF